MTAKQEKALQRLSISSGKHSSEQEIAVAMVHRINEAIKILHILEIDTPIDTVVYHHYNNSVEESCKK